MPRRRKTDKELAATGSANLSRRRAAKKRRAARAEVARVVAAAPVTKSPPLPRTAAAWHALIRMLPGFDPFVLGDGFRFDRRAAAKPIKWIEANVRHSKGPKAGQQLILEPWQRAFVANLFGWLRIDNGLRRFREFLLYVPKKSGKTELCAAIALYMLLEDDEGGAEVYCAASSRRQAAKLFDQCKKQMARVDPDETLATRYQHSILKPDGGFLQTISSDAKTEDGMNPSCALLDELWTQPDGELFDVLRLSGRARSQPLFGSLSTADHDRPSICNDTLDRARKIRANPGDPAREGYDPEFLPAIYEADPKADPYAPATWAACNPNLGVTVELAAFAKEARDAKDNPGLRPSFFRLCLNLRVGMKDSLFKPEDWDACIGPETYQQLRKRLRGKRCFGGLDLATVTDLASLCLWFPEEKAAIWMTWCPRDGAAERTRSDRVPYMVWADEGALILTGDGPSERTVSYRRIRADIQKLVKDEFDVQEIAFDRTGANETVTALRDDDGVKFLDFSQTAQAYTGPMKEAYRMHVAHEFVHGGDPCARWALLNVVNQPDHNDNWFPSKKRARERIDPAVAFFMAVGASLLQPKPRGKRAAGFVSFGGE